MKQINVSFTESNEFWLQCNVYATGESERHTYHKHFRFSTLEEAQRALFDAANWLATVKEREEKNEI